MEKKYSNENKVSVWEKVSKGGKRYYSGTINIKGVDYNFSFFDNENRKSENSPVFTGSLREDKQ